MIRLMMEQGTREWLQAKCGIVSASNLSRIITKSMKPSTSQAAYCHELLAETLIGRPLDDATSQFMQRGTAFEDEARKWYALQQDVDVEQVGFLLRDDGRVGCSPDGLIGEDGGVEIKTPAAAKHVAFLLGEVPEEWKAQIQGSLWITGREWWDFVSYNPELPSVLLRVKRDEPFIAAMETEVEKFLAYVEDMKARLRHQGVLQDGGGPMLKVVA